MKIRLNFEIEAFLKVEIQLRYTVITCHICVSWYLSHFLHC
jgi:hypothetical protein